MALFDAKSRYANADAYVVLDRHGRAVTVIATPELPEESFLGWHRRMQGTRLDHLAARYLEDPAGFWRLCDLNGAVLPDALAETFEVAIPVKERR
jgi:hypothetical protein